MGHFLQMAALLPPGVPALLGLPEQHTKSQEEEETREEDREEDKEVDVGLILPEEQQSLSRAVGTGQHHQVEPSGLERVQLVGVGENQAVPDVADHQRRPWVTHRHVGDQARSAFLAEVGGGGGGGRG